MSFEPVRVASLGMGWWSDVLADAIQKTNKLKMINYLNLLTDNCPNKITVVRRFVGKLGMD